MKSANFISTLITKDDKDFDKEIRLRKKNYIEKKVPRDEEEKYLKQGYEVKKRYKNNTSLFHNSNHVE